MPRVLLLFTQAVVAMAHDPLGPGASTTWPLTDPSEIGLSANALADATLAVGDVGTMMCFAIAVNGALVVDETYLESPFTKGRKRAMESMSAAKTVTSIVMGGAMHDGLFTLDKTLASYGVVPHGANWSDNWNGMYVVICSPSLSLSLSLSPSLSLFLSPRTYYPRSSLSLQGRIISPSLRRATCCHSPRAKDGTCLEPL